MERASHQADDEVVVVGVQPVAGQANVVRVIGVAVRPSDGGVLVQDLALLLPAEPREGAGAPQRVPDGPGPGRIQHGAPRALQQPLREVGLEAGGVRAADHGELGPVRECLEGLGGQHLAEARHEESRVLGQREHADAAGVVEVAVEDGVGAAPLQRDGQGLRIGAAREHLKLDEQAPVEGLAAGAALRDVHLVRLPAPGAWRPRSCPEAITGPGLAPAAPSVGHSARCGATTS